MRRITAIILLNIFLFIIGGNYLLFCWQKHVVQHEIKERIENGLKDEDLTLVIVPLQNLSSIKWIKPEKEFVKNGEMFDVIKKKYIDNKVYFYCINDKKEAKLISGYNKNGLKNLTVRLLRRFLGLNFYKQDNQLNKLIASGLKLEFCNFSNYCTLTLEIPDPPPNCA